MSIRIITRTGGTIFLRAGVHPAYAFHEFRGYMGNIVVEENAQGIEEIAWIRNIGKHTAGELHRRTIAQENLPPPRILRDGEGIGPEELDKEFGLGDTGGAASIEYRKAGFGPETR